MRFLFLQFNRLKKESQSSRNMVSSMVVCLIFSSRKVLCCYSVVWVIISVFSVSLNSGYSYLYCSVWILSFIPAFLSSCPCCISLPYAFCPAVSQFLSLAVSSHSAWLCCPCFSVFLLIWPLIYQTSSVEYTVVPELEKSLDEYEEKNKKCSFIKSSLFLEFWCFSSMFLRISLWT